MKPPKNNEESIWTMHMVRSKHLRIKKDQKVTMTTYPPDSKAMSKEKWKTDLDHAYGKVQILGDQKGPKVE